MPDEDIDEEVEALVTALRDGGELNRDELGRRVNCRLWGPGRYRRALAVAMQRGQIRGHAAAELRGARGTRLRIEESGFATHVRTPR